MNILSQRWLTPALCTLLCVSTLFAQQHNFTVKDDIDIVRFGNIWGDALEGGLLESPDGKWLCVHTVRADLKDDRVHDQVRMYRTQELQDSGAPSAVKPVWMIEGSVVPLGEINATLIQLKWVGGNRLAFLKWTVKGNKQLFLADPARRRVRALTGETQDVISYAITDERNYTYTTPAQKVKDALEEELRQPERIAGDREVFRLLFPEKAVAVQLTADLWSVRDGQSRRVVDPETHQPFRVLGDGIRDLALSPDGRWISTIRPFRTIPKSWLEKYPSPNPMSMYRVQAGNQDLDRPVNWGVVGEYVVIDRRHGEVTSLTHGPDALRLGWLESFGAGVAWSADGRFVFLPSAFADAPWTSNNRPCSVVVDMQSRQGTCMRPLRKTLETSTEDGYARMYSARFIERPADKPSVEIEMDVDRKRQFVSFSQTNGDVWVQGQPSLKATAPQRFEVRQDMHHAPVLVRKGTASSKDETVFDPNPQLRQVRLGEVEEYRWSDEGHHWSGLLYRPIGYKRGRRYPLVIQTHGYDVTEFMPSGSFQSAFIAQELAAVGVMVLQVRDCPGRGNLSEAPCNVSAYEAAVKGLSAEEGADPEHVGLIGFSRTVLYVLKALVSSKVDFAAASINDGLSDSYLSYILAVGGLPIGLQDLENIAGGTPLGQGMANWLKNSPDFNTETITTPLRITSEKGVGILTMWEPYARLKLGRQSTELAILNTESHLIAQPTVRRVAQEGNLDWFRFWLQGYEDANSDKASQYIRWEKMKSLSTTPLMR